MSKEERELRRLVRGARRVLQEPILKSLMENSSLTKTQLETLLIDIVVEDKYGDHITYEKKASLRSNSSSEGSGITRGAFNRTLRQARRNVTECLHTMLLLAYLGLFDYTIFRPFEEIATRIGNYRQIRETLAGKQEVSDEEIESYTATEKTLQNAIDQLASSLSMKTTLSRKQPDSSE
ncbi:MAG: hypothetical protein ACOC38_00490 [Promethearchaeia archaeon]